MASRPLREHGISSYEYLKLVEEKGRVGHWSWHLASGRQTWSLGFYRMIGVEPGSVEPSLDRYLELLHPEDRLDEGQLHRIRREGLLGEREFRIIRPDGGLRWLSNRGEVLYDRNGRPDRAFGVVIDITAQQHARFALTHQHDRADLVAELLGATVVSIDPSGALEDSVAWRALTCQSLDEAQGTGWAAAIHPDDRDRVLGVIDAARASTIAGADECRILPSYGTERWLRLRVRALRDDQGSTRELVAAWLPIDARGAGLDGEAMPAHHEARFPTAAQVRAARAIMGWSLERLATAAGVSISTVRRIEEDDGSTVARAESVHAIRTALETGVIFTFPLGRSPGVAPRA